MNSMKLWLCVFLLFLPLFNPVKSQTYSPINQVVDPNPSNSNTGDQDETSIAVDPTNPLHLMSVWNETQPGMDTKPGYGFSTDGGTTWQTGILTADNGGLPPLYALGFDPSCAIDKLGNAFFLFDGAVTGGGNVVLSRTTNNGQTLTSRLLTQTFNEDKPYLAVDNNNKIYVSWTDELKYTDSTRYSIYVAYSSSHGDTFSSPYLIATALNVTPGAPPITFSPLDLNQTASYPIVHAAIPAIDQNGNVYVVWLDMAGATNVKIKIRKSTNGGASYAVAVDVTPNPIHLALKFGVGAGGIFRASSLPTIAIDPTNGYIYVAWTQLDTLNDLNVYYSRSTNGGTTWCPDGGTTSCNGKIATASLTNQQYFPQLSASSAGVISLSYYQGTGSTFDVYLAELYSNATSFYAPNTRVSTTSGATLNSATGTPCDYMGIASGTGGDVFPCWFESIANSSTDPYIARYNSKTKLAYENRSLDNSSTWHNGGRHLAKGGGKLHEAFTSGGEIFYRRSPNTLGTSWELTRRASSVTGGNTTSSVIAASGNSVHLVWERMVGSFLFDIYYSRSTDNGTNWTSPITLPGCTNISVSSTQWNTYPVIAELNATPKQIVVVFTTSSGLKYTRSTDNGATWLGAPGSISTSCPTYAWYLSMAPGSNYLTLSYDCRYNGVYSRTYNGTSWSSEANVNAGTGTIYDRQSSIAVDDQDRPIAAWCSQKSGQSEYRILYRQGTSANTWSPGFVEFAKTTGISDYYPSIAYLSRIGVYGIDIVYYRSTNEVRVNKLVNGSWVTPVTLSTSGRWANTSLENNSSGYPVRAWTDQTAIPYEVKRSSDDAYKVAATGYEHHRRVVLQSIQNRSTLELEVAQPTISKTSGELVFLPFKLADITQIKSVSLENIWDYIGTEALVLPSDAKWLSVGKTIASDAFHDSSRTPEANTFASIPPYSLQVLDGRTGKLLSTLDADGVSGTATFDVSAFAGRSVILRASLNISTSLGSNLTLGVGDIYYEQNAMYKQSSIVPPLSPRVFELSDNYPNPFNPSTRIAFEVPVQSEVSLKVFNVLGGVVATLVSGVKDAGKQSVEWDANGIASGVYFYRLEATSTTDPVKSFSQVKKMLLLR